jgi:hypothetical protein
MVSSFSLLGFYGEASTRSFLLELREISAKNGTQLELIEYHAAVSGGLRRFSSTDR